MVLEAWDDGVYRHMPVCMLACNAQLALRCPPRPFISAPTKVSDAHHTLLADMPLLPSSLPYAFNRLQGQVAYSAGPFLFHVR